jgi:hypothetical protein
MRILDQDKGVLDQEQDSVRPQTILEKMKMNWVLSETKMESKLEI